MPPKGDTLEFKEWTNRKRYKKKMKCPLWGAFRRTLEQSGFGDLGEDPGGGAVLTFDRDWTPRLLARV